MVHLYSLYACVCAILHLFCRFSCYVYVCILLLHLFCNYFRFCVDVGIEAATSLCCSGNLFFSVFLYCTCSMLLLYKMLEHVCVFLYVAAYLATSCLFLYVAAYVATFCLFGEFSKSQYSFYCTCSLTNVLYDVGTCLCDLDRSTSLGLLVGEYSLKIWLNQP